MNIDIDKLKNILETSCPTKWVKTDYHNWTYYELKLNDDKRIRIHRWNNIGMVIGAHDKITYQLDISTKEIKLEHEYLEKQFWRIHSVRSEIERKANEAYELSQIVKINEALNSYGKQKPAPKKNCGDILRNFFNGP